MAPVALPAMQGGGNEAPARALRGAHGPTADAHAWLVSVAERLRLSARGYARVLRVSRTIADLDGAEQVCRDAVAEALGLRGVG